MAPNLKEYKTEQTKKIFESVERQFILIHIPALEILFFKTKLQVILGEGNKSVLRYILFQPERLILKKTFHVQFLENQQQASLQSLLNYLFKSSPIQFPIHYDLLQSCNDNSMVLVTKWLVETTPISNMEPLQKYHYVLNFKSFQVFT